MDICDTKLLELSSSFRSAGGTSLLVHVGLCATRMSALTQLLNFGGGFCDPISEHRYSFQQVFAQQKNKKLFNLKPTHP